MKVLGKDWVVERVTVHFVGGPADGAVRQLPPDPEGGPLTELLMPGKKPAGGSTIEYLYRRDEFPDEDGTWTMRHVD